MLKKNWMLLTFLLMSVMLMACPNVVLPQEGVPTPVELPQAVEVAEDAGASATVEVLEGVDEADSEATLEEKVGNIITDHFRSEEFEMYLDEKIEAKLNEKLDERDKRILEQVDEKILVQVPQIVEEVAPGIVGPEVEELLPGAAAKYMGTHHKKEFSEAAADAMVKKLADMGALRKIEPESKTAKAPPKQKSILKNPPAPQSSQRKSSKPSNQRSSNQRNYNNYNSLPSGPFPRVRRFLFGG